MREVVRNKSLVKKYLRNRIIIKIVLAFLTFGLIALYVNLLGYDQKTIFVVYLVSLSSILTSIFGIFYSIFQSYEKMEYQSLGQVLNIILMFSGVIIAMNLGFDVIGFSLIYLISSLITLVFILLIHIWKFYLPKIEIDFIFWSQTMKEALPYGITGIFVMIYYWIDSIMLSIMAENEIVGWYNTEYKIVYIFLYLYSIYIISIFPVMSNLYKISIESLKFTFERSFKYLLIISTPIGIITTFIASKLILIIYGVDYIPSIIALQILIWTLIFMFLNNLSDNLLGSVNKQLIVTKITGLGAILNILLNLILIPKFSYIGASFATVITEFLLMPILIYVIWKNKFTNLTQLLKDLPKIIFSSLVLIIFLFYPNNLNLIILIPASLGIYVVSIYLSNTLDETDILFIKHS